MATVCAHKNVQFFGGELAADRLIGRWRCPDCGFSFAKNPLDPNSVTYLDHPNPRATKTIVSTPERNPDKMRDV